MNLELFTFTESNVFFINYNGLNSFIIYFFDQYDLIMSHSKDNLDEFFALSLRILIISIVLILIVAFILTTLLGRAIFA